MTELLVVLVSAFVVIAATTLIGPRLGIASPLVLVAIGVGASFLPVFAGVHIDPEWILAGVLPPLLYSSAVSIPAMDFRREFGAISGLSVLLVVGSALLLGLFFSLVIPGLGFAWGVALGAIVSPTDAVATSWCVSSIDHHSAAPGHAPRCVLLGRDTIRYPSFVGLAIHAPRPR